jgi:hypothetical protein
VVLTAALSASSSLDEEVLMDSSERRDSANQLSEFIKTTPLIPKSIEGILEHWCSRLSVTMEGDVFSPKLRDSEGTGSSKGIGGSNDIVIDLQDSDNDSSADVPQHLDEETYENWSVEEVGIWLAAKGLQSCTETFKKLEISGFVFEFVTSETLVNNGLTWGAAMAAMKHITNLIPSDSKPPRKKVKTGTDKEVCNNFLNFVTFIIQYLCLLRRKGRLGTSQ